MTSATMIVMLIWAGNQSYGGPATIGGFETLAACERALPVVQEIYRGWIYRGTFKCVELPTR